MGLFNRLSGFFGMFTTIVVPRPAYAGSSPASAPNRIALGPYLPPRITSRKSSIDRMDASEFRALSLEEQTDIHDFVAFRYADRISNPRFRSASIYDIKNDLVKKLQVPVGKGHKYLTKELIEKFIL